MIISYFWGTQNNLMKNTPFTHHHIALGAKMAEFAGYNMPISYSGIKDEHHCVRNGVGVFDVSHMGEFIVKGKEAMELIQHVTTNDVAKLEIGDAQYSCLPNADGGIVDDLLVFRLPEDQCAEGERAYMLIVNASNIKKDWDWISSHNSFDTKLINISDQTALLAVQGPTAAAALQALTEVDMAGIEYYNFKKGTFAGVENVILSATGYTGSGGFEIYFDKKDADKVWEAVFKAGESFGIKPIGLAARDTLRLEMGFCLYGNDIDDTTSPIEAGLGWITKLGKGTFVSSDKIAAVKESGGTRRLVGFVMDGKRIPRNGCSIVDAEGNSIGRVTSGSKGPSVEKGIGLGYVDKPHHKKGTEIFIEIRSNKERAVVTRPPFYKK